MIIQIVDDNEKFRETLRKFILPLTTDIIENDNGRTAVETYFKMQPDFVLMDLKMPEMDGLTATLEIIQRYPKAQIIFITDSFRPSINKILLDVGAVAIYPKENLQAVVEYINKVIK